LRPLEAVTLDVTGTLIHCPRMGEIYVEVLARHGIVVEADQVRREFRNAWRELDCSTPAGVDRFTHHPDGQRGWWRRLLERLCELVDVERPSQFAAAELFNRFRHPDAWEIYPEVPDALAELRGEGLRLAVVSNWDDRLPELLAELGLARHLNEIVHSSALGIAKPDPEIFLYALRRLGVEADAAMHVGDNAREDLEGAVAVGMQALLLDRRGDEGDVADLGALVQEVASRRALVAPDTVILRTRR